MRSLVPNKPPKPPRRQFTFEEDKILKEAVKEYGDSDWEKISSRLKNRTPRQCRDRWNKYLSPNVRDSMWTDEEDQILLNLIEKYGNKWSKISTFLNGRSDISIKNRYKQILAQNNSSINNVIPMQNNFNTYQTPQFYQFEYSSPITNNIMNQPQVISAVQNTVCNNDNNNNINNSNDSIHGNNVPKNANNNNSNHNNSFLESISIDPIIPENASTFNARVIQDLHELFESLGPIQQQSFSRPSLKM